jgi:hypothetical protein
MCQALRLATVGDEFPVHSTVLCQCRIERVALCELIAPPRDVRALG